MNKETNQAFIPCEHCGKLHSDLTWTFPNKTQTGNWFGYYCICCGKIISVHRSLLAWALIVLTYPLWFWKRDDLKQRWLNKQPERFRHLNLDENYFLMKSYRLRRVIALVVAGSRVAFVLTLFLLYPHLTITGNLLLIVSVPLLASLYLAYRSYQMQKKYERLQSHSQ